MRVLAIIALLLLQVSCSAESYKHPQIAIETSLGTMTFELYEDKAPNTVANFITLAEKGFYRDLKFHRIVRGMLAQGGCPNTKKGANGPVGKGDPGYYIKEEFHKSLKHVRGMLTMARKREPATSGSQFCIFFDEYDHLDGAYTVFGKLIKGEEVLKKLEAAAVKGKPKEPKEVTFSVKVLSKNKKVYKVNKTKI